MRPEVSCFALHTCSFESAVKDVPILDAALLGMPARGLAQFLAPDFEMVGNRMQKATPAEWPGSVLVRS